MIVRILGEKSRGGAETLNAEFLIKIFETIGYDGFNSLRYDKMNNTHR